nr:MAG TPA: hypothetical protein [Caudoviricetes sp.]
MRVFYYLIRKINNYSILQNILVNNKVLVAYY